MNDKKEIIRKPDWLKAPLPHGGNYSMVKNLIKEYNLHTICSSGNCPNKGECWSAGTATFMILGNICTRNCSFCYVDTARPKAPDKDEPEKIAGIIRMLKLNHCVITSVNRDDLPDQGAAIWANTIIKVKEVNPNTTMEVLIPDFSGNNDLIKLIILASPDVISHNIETVRRLTPVVRSKADYDTSLSVLRYISASGITTKSGIMLGLGETKEEIVSAMDDLLNAGVRVLTVGQYIQPSPLHLKVADYIKPEIFEELKTTGLRKGFAHVESGPLVRSSYHAERHVRF